MNFKIILPTLLQLVELKVAFDRGRGKQLCSDEGLKKMAKAVSDKL
jgi:hypothetical protein